MAAKNYEKPELAFLYHVQQHLDGENINAQIKCPNHKYKLNRLYSRISGFINLLKKEIK